MEDAIAACYTDSSKEPSFLELQMSADFLSFFPEAFKDVLARLTSKFPCLQPLLDNWRLVLAVGLVTLEGRSLSKHSATISERFFRLRRFSTFSRLLVLLSLLESAVLPCLPEDAVGVQSYRTLAGIYRVLFLFGVCKFFSPIQHLGNITFPSRGGTSEASKMGRVLYAVQLLQWIQANQGLFGAAAARRLPEVGWAFTAAPPPEDPRRRALSAGRLPLPVDASICAICQKPRTNPTAVISGYVFCYPCIERWRREVGQFCPITRAPIKELRRLYY